MLFASPALLGGVDLDDRFVERLVNDGGDVTNDAFAFVDARVSTPHLSEDDLPWWTAPDLRLHFYRPLAGLSHRLDWALWPSVPALMHLHSLLWYGLLVLLVRAMHRGANDTDAGARRAALATLVFALSQAHAMNVGWVAARNSLIGSGLAGGAWLAHRAWRRDGRRGLGVLSPLLLALALLANEGSVAVLSYFAAFALVQDRGRMRFVALAPHALVVIAWRAWTSAAGFGAVSSGMYLEPQADPLAFAWRTFVHGTLLLAGRLGLAVLDGLGNVPGAYVAALALAVPFVGVMIWVVARRARSDDALRMWGLGALGATLTAGALVPTDRNLLTIGIGACFVLADLMLAGLAEGERRPVRILAGVLAVAHLVLSPLLFPLRVLSPSFVEWLAQPIEAALPEDPSITERSVVMLQAPSDLVMLYLRVTREARGAPLPARINYLYAGMGALELERTSEQVIVLRSSAPWLAAPLDRMFRSDLDFTVGQRFAGPCFDATIEAISDDALPVTVRFDLHARGPRCEPVFMAWDGAAPRPFELPPVGERVTFAPATLPAAE